MSSSHRLSKAATACLLMSKLAGVMGRRASKAPPNTTFRGTAAPQIKAKLKTTPTMDQAFQSEDQADGVV